MNRRKFTTALLVPVLGVLIASSQFNAATAQTPAPDDPVVLAHYYIWFDASSWDRAKSDYPALGRYSSDQASVMREHIVMAKSAGVDGFIVSWKSTATLDRRLEQLIEIADEEDFKLALTYQGLDFNRDPLPPDRIGEDLDHFLDQYASSPVFDLFERPLVVLTGTWEFADHELSQITDSRRDDLMILASEKDVAGYQRVAPLVDGNLYYWSSVNPNTNPDYPEKLVRMAAAVRADQGMWIAPVAPGFDARLVGGTQVVPREEGETLRAEWQAALTSLPDAIGIISWNEFSENTHIEPSLNYQATALEVVADLTGSPAPGAIDFDSSAPEGSPSFNVTGAMSLALLAVTLIGSTVIMYRRRSRQTEETSGFDRDDTDPGVPESD